MVRVHRRPAAYNRSAVNTRRALRANPYFDEQAKWFRRETALLLVTAASAGALTFAGSNIRSNPIVIAWMAALVAADFILLAKWLSVWRRLWREQNRIEQRTSSDLAAARLAELLGDGWLPAKIVGIGAVAAILLLALTWSTNVIVAAVCSLRGLTASLFLAWSLAHHEAKRRQRTGRVRSTHPAS